jgi:hypothetical protein
MSQTTRTRPSCDDLAERLAPHAVADDDDEVAVHVEGCASCRKEIGALRETLRAVKDAARMAPRDEAFWTDLGRDVRLAWDRAEEERTRRRWWGLPRAVWVGLGIAVTGAAALLLVLRLRGAPDTIPPEAGGPQSGFAGWGGSEGHELPMIDEEDIEGEDLDRVLTALEEAQDREVERAIRNAATSIGIDRDAAEALTGETDPYETVEDLDDDELERVLAALAKGV